MTYMIEQRTVVVILHRKMSPGTVCYSLSKYLLNGTGNCYEEPEQGLFMQNVNALYEYTSQFESMVLSKDGRLAY